jgi:phospholipid-binding lipoprotein MlaA
VAAASGYDYHDEDFGQTLGVYGVGSYPYLVLPVLGPSTARDGVGMLVDSYLDPLGYVVDDEIQFGRRLVSGIDFRARNIENLEELKRDSIDFYARIRSVFLQRRVDEINNGERSDSYPAPGLSWDGIDDDQLSISE